MALRVKRAADESLYLADSGQDEIVVVGCFKIKFDESGTHQLESHEAFEEMQDACRDRLNAVFRPGYSLF